MQRGDETDTVSNAYLVIELHFVKVSQVGCISRIVYGLLRGTFGVFTAPKPISYLITCNSSFTESSSHCSRMSVLGTYVLYVYVLVCNVYCVRVPDLGSEIAIVDWRITSLLHFRLAFNSMRSCRYCLSATRSLTSVSGLLRLSKYSQAIILF